LAAQPLIDLDTVDLTRVVAGRDAIRRHCLQRNRFEMIDAIVLHDIPGEVIVGFKEIRRDDWWAPDHIPGRPLFPGVLQIEGAAQMCSYDFMERMPNLEGKFVGFGGVDATRFRAQVEPDCRLVFVAKPRRMRSSMFTYSAQGFVDKKLVFETEIIGVVL
jgi:3-hydroxymyristoyl/3-hydroxydecanoyl-(acyl carrier protein) dehydratase